jgi:hypothetical protein
MGAGLVAAWLGVWASGSRTALAAAAIVTATVGMSALITSYRQRLALKRWPAVAGAGVILIGLLLAVSTRRDVVGPLERARDTLPSLTGESIRAFAQEMWNRNGYGTAAMQAIDDYPAFGLGVGSFHVMFADFAKLTGVGPQSPDNAQNWYRHQLAEFGVVGSLAWIAWTAAFAAFVVKHPAGAAAATWAGRGTLCALALVSLVGMPGQDLMVTLTFWAVAYWYTSLAGRPESRALSLASWTAIGLVVVLFGIGTATSAAGTLRVPVRAQRVGWPYAYGFYPPEHDQVGEFRWTAGHAVAVIDAPTRTLEVSVSANHRDLAEHPVEARVWCDGKLVIEARLTDSSPVVQRVRLPDGEARVLIETRASRTVRPSDFGLPDERTLGVMVRWRFDEGEGTAVSTQERSHGPEINAGGNLFRLNSMPTFLVFVSMFDALRERGRPDGDGLIRGDLAYLRDTLHVDGVRILPNWWACGAGCRADDLLDPRPGTPADDGLFDARDGAAQLVRSSKLADLKDLLQAASEAGLIVDLTFTRETMNVAAEGQPPAEGDMKVADYMSAIVEVARALVPYRNVIFDLQNEFRLHGLSEGDVKAIAAAVHDVDSGRLVTASVSASSLSPADAAGVAARAGLDAVAYHDSREQGWFTEARYRAAVNALQSDGMVRPVYFQEPTAFGPRPGDDRERAHFTDAAAAAKRAGAAAWTLHQRAGFVLTAGSFRERLQDRRLAGLSATIPP